MGVTAVRRDITEEKAAQRRAFSNALIHIMELKGITQRELGERLGMSHTVVTGWRNLVHEPAPETVFRVEEELGLPGGTLSIHLGYVPPEARSFSGPDEFDAFIDADPQLDDRARRMLKVMYAELRAPQPKRRRAP